MRLRIVIGLAVQDIIILYKVLFRRLCPLQKRERQTIDQRLQRANLGLRHLGRMLVRIVLISLDLWEHLSFKESFPCFCLMWPGTSQLIVFRERSRFFGGRRKGFLLGRCAMMALSMDGEEHNKLWECNWGRGLDLLWERVRFWALLGSSVSSTLGVALFWQWSQIGLQQLVLLYLRLLVLSDVFDVLAGYSGV